MIYLRAMDAECACGHQAYELKETDEPDCIICLDCGSGMFKTNFDADTGDWHARCGCVS
jgi:hypothetical protein